MKSDTATTAAPRLTVFYDGGCPLCLKEVSFYRRRRGADAIAWVDVSEGTGGDITPGLSRCDALARFHVQEADGRLQNGAAAFIALWTALPSFSLAGRLASWAPVTWVLEQAYTQFLKVRPAIQRQVRGKMS